jgi:DNA-binding response OmpR family regulator
MKTILLVEDDRDIMRLNSKLFKEAGYRVLEAGTVAASVRIMQNERPDVIVLDIMLPDGNGLALCRKLRGENSEPPILFLSARNQPLQIVDGLKSGGDGYLPKPYDLNVLLANVEALLRRASHVPKTVSKGPLNLDIASNQAVLNGKDMLLTQKEFALLLLFIQNEGRRFSAEYLYDKVWKASMNSDARVVRYHISILRKKLSRSGYTIVSRRGEGYVFGKG